MTTIPATIHERLPQTAAMTVRPAPSPGAAVSVGDIIGIIKRRVFLIAFVWFFFILLTVVGTYFQIKYFPVWRASALLKVEPGMPLQPAEEVDPRFVRSDIIERLLLDEASAIKAVPVLQQALLDADVITTRWYRDVEDYLRVEQLDEDLHASPIEGTSLFRVGIACRTQDDPHRIVNAVVRAYMSIKEQQSRADFRNRMKDYQDQEALHFGELTAKLEEIARFRNRVAVPGAVSGVNVLGESLTTTASLLTQLQADKLEIQALYEVYESSEELAVSPQVIQLVEGDPAVSNLRYKVQALAEELSVAQDTFGSRHRQVRLLTHRLRVTESELAQLRAERLGEVKDYQRDQARVAYLQMVDQELSLRERYEQMLAEQRDLDRDLADYEKLLAEQRLIEEKYNQVRSYVGDLQFLLRQRDTLQISVAQSAPAPLERSSPQWIINVPMGTLLGLILAVALALLLDLLDTSIRAPLDISRHLHLALLGTIPDADDDETVIASVETAVLDAPRSLLAEAFRTVRTNLFFAAAAARQRSLLLTSPHPGDGTTAVLVNLGACLAHACGRVLLIDANFRRPALHRIFKGTNEAGLSNVLVGQAEWRDLVRKTPLDNLDYLPSGPTAPNPSELLGSDYMRTFLESANAQYDQVLFDAPPALLASDALVLSTMVDGAILICRARANTRGVSSRARDLLQQVGARILGAILNAAQVRRGGYFREQLRTYYDYQPEELEPEETPPALPKGEKNKKRKKPDKTAKPSELKHPDAESTEDSADNRTDSDQT